MDFLRSCAKVFKFSKSPPPSPTKGKEKDQQQQQEQLNGASESCKSPTNGNDNVNSNSSQSVVVSSEGLSSSSENKNNSSSNSTKRTPQIDKTELYSIDFSSFSKSKEELIDCSVSIFEETGIIDHFSVDRNDLQFYLSKVRESYKDNPFHSFNHAVTVTQMIFLLIIKTQLLHILTPIEKLSILIASVCHDLDHPGVNNRYQINMKTELALLYNNKSVLENHHLQTCLSILNQDGKKLLNNLTDDEKQQLYEKVRILILATDMENHFVYKEKFDNIIPVFDWENKEHRELLMIMLLKSADISNELRTWDVSSQWANALMQEFFKQSDLEKENNLPLTPFMVREKVVLNSTQVSFIDKFLLPTYQALQNILPACSVFIERINQNRQTWEQCTN